MPDPDPNESPIAYESPDVLRPASCAPTESQLEGEAIGFSPKHDPYAALRYGTYRLFSFGWMIAVVGNQMTAVALGWEVFDRTRSALALGWLAGVQVIPLVFLALPAGVIADRFDRRRLIQITAALNALCSIGLGLLSYRSGSLPWMFACVIGSATVLALGRPARSALLPNIVPASVFSNAITWNSSIFQVSAMVGPALGGLLIEVSQREFHSLFLPYMLDAGSALFYAAVMLWIPRPTSGHERIRNDSPGATSSAAANENPPNILDYGVDRPSALQQLSAGIRFVFNTKIILATLTLDLFAVLLGGAAYLLPVFAKDILQVDSRHFGWLRAAEAGGAVVMALLLAHLPPMKRAGRSMLTAVALFGVCTIVFGLSRNFWLSFWMLVMIGAVDNVSVVVRHTLVQVLTPDHMRGRVSAVNGVFIGASNELGGLESGLTAEWLGPVISVVAGGIGTLITVLATAIAFPQLRKFGPLQPRPPEQTLRGRAGATVAKSA
jgi:MFS family permease